MIQEISKLTNRNLYIHLFLFSVSKRIIKKEVDGYG